MKAKKIKVGSGVPNKSYYNESEEINELIRIANCFPELRNRNRNENQINPLIFINLIKFKMILINNKE